MATVFVKELGREVEVVLVNGCYFTEYGEYYACDEDEVVELYQKGEMKFDTYNNEFYMLIDEGTVYTVATIKEIN